MTPNIHPSRLILDELTTAIMVVDAEHRILSLNHAAEELFRVSARQVHGQELEQAIRATDIFSELINTACTSGGSYTQRERRVNISDQRMVTIDCTVTPLEGERVLIEIAEVDRHTRITKEHNLVVQNRAIAELLRGLAHEVKNPLGGLRGAAQLLEAELSDNELREYTQVIISEADRLKNLVDTLLGPKNPTSPEIVNVHEVLERVRALVDAEGIEGEAGVVMSPVPIVRDYDPSIPLLYVERDHLIQALLNLVRNARQSAGPQGNIILRTRTQRQMTIADKVHRLVARIDVEDDGPGIPVEQQEQIFFPMVTSRAEGSGLGLPIAQNLVSRMGGLIEFTSEPGCTVFTIWLPMETDHE
ncbi:nitrogen regulation protein NtrB [Halorhodospira halochloris]|uniref:Sensory histidine kinase/phosphatase NtrB n=1 Tax=Halorhodospira halochloris TaxID=1052 RepID=A0A110B4F3_HALHR|nr:nitrogen regulation protein NR(II) [Halorhodospira halochloris]MBK1650820.1 PAS domain-containing sensor histidine kinase [Halorhodospira halochloris]BAU56681.1 nitrogen regulation protein NtrB [Halorhodospira halochloris]